jgi:ketosteroid isomerase-like protein
MLRERVHAFLGQLLDALVRRDLERLMPFYAPDAVVVSPVFGEVRGRAAIGATFDTLFRTLADGTVEIGDVLIDGDRVAVIGTITTTDRTGWFGLRPTGSVIRYRLMLLLTIADGQIVRDERIYDSTGVLERLEKARLDKELHTAADVQRALLPRTAHVARFCESVGSSVPCRAIGGDFFEFVELPSGDVGIAMGDVAGKGPAAALLAAMLQGMFAADAVAGAGPAVTLSRMNQRLAARRLESRFATLVYAVLSSDGRLIYSNAGHNPPALLARDGIRRLGAGGPILGAFADATFAEETLRLDERDTLVMFTDGVTEARNGRDEEFGEQRTINCLTQQAAASPSCLLNHLFTALRDFCDQAEQSDDITVTVTRFHRG